MSTIFAIISVIGCIIAGYFALREPISEWISRVRVHAQHERDLESGQSSDQATHAPMPGTFESPQTPRIGE